MRPSYHPFPSRERAVGRPRGEVEELGRAEELDQADRDGDEGGLVEPHRLPLWTSSCLRTPT